MHWNAAVLSARTADTRPSIVVTFDSAKYVFGCGEGASRSYQESTSRWARTRAIFCERTDMRKTSGLAGLIMAMADGCPKLDIVGPPTTSYLLQAMRTFLRRDSIAINCIEVVPTFDPKAEPRPAFQDKNVTVYAMHILPTHAEGYFDPQTYEYVTAAPDDLASAPSTPSARSPGRDRRERLEDPANPPRKRHRDESPMPTFKRRRYLGDSDAPRRSRSPSQERYPGDSPDFRGSHDFSSTAVPAAKSTSPYAAASPKARGKLIMAEMFPAPVVPVSTDLDYKPPAHVKKTKKEKKGSAPDKAEEEVVAAPNPPIWKRVRPDDFFAQLEPPFPTRGWAADGAQRVPKAPTLSWMIIGPRVKGKFDEAKAVALGVPRGPARKQLVDGQDISFQVPDKDAPGGVKVVQVKSDQVVGPSETPAAVFVLNCPSPDFIQPLIDQFAHGTWYSKFGMDLPDEHKVRTVFHVCGRGVMEDYRYREFMHFFPADVQHIVSSADHDANPVSYVAAATQQLFINNLDPEAFPVSKYKNESTRPLSTLSNLPENVTPMAANLVVPIHPAGPPKEGIVSEEHHSFRSMLNGTAPVVLSGMVDKALKEAKLRVAAPMETRASEAKEPGDDVQVITLGTGSSVATKLRGVSGNIIRIPNKGAILLDAGEGTWGQMARMFGTDRSQPNNVWDVLRSLKCIFVSHPHGDHQTGVPLILAKRAALDPPPKDSLWVVAGERVLLGLREMAELDDFGIDHIKPGGVKLVNGDALHWGQGVPYSWRSREPWMNEGMARLHAEDMCQKLGLTRFSTVNVSHSCRAIAAVIDHSDDWRIVYSGDTRPCPQLASAGAGATLLIHEATFGDDQYEMAEHKKHSTVSEAIDMARQMGAKNTLLTHFSARYPRLTPRSQARAPGPLMLATDGASVRIGDMWKMPLYTPAVREVISALTAGEEEEMVPNTDW